MRQWQLQDAKARFSELVKRARREGPQEVTVHGEPAVVVVAAEEFNRLRAPKTPFIEFLRTSPLAGIDLDIERDTSPPRTVDL